MYRSTRARSTEEMELPVLDPLWFEPDGPARPRTTRRLLVVGLVVAAIGAGSAGTHWLEQGTRTRMAPAMGACQEAIDATARLHRLQGAQLGLAMQATWAAVAGVHVQATSVDNSLNARLQREADDAIAQCISPANS
jgi:hypothetical protein